MTGKEMPSSPKKPQRSTFSRIVWIAFIVAFIVVFALVAMAWLTIQKSDFGPSAGDASAPQQGVEIWQPSGASAAAGQTYSLPPAADMNAASQASEPAQERPAASRRATPATPAEEEVPIQPVAPQQETEIRPIEVPVKPVPQPQPRQPGGDGGGNPVDSLF
ncbi:MULTISPECIES: hypothetical protein [Eikenella]|uniref:Uncharacterized protein n=1 Tax=Eikenella exigua TaxID=2528037 RepID=A0AAX1F8J5_9NEIS|nr:MULTISPECIES: hypothetical protein [Eikenella]OAM27321.1 hypothetical protein A7P94_05860 [Eikenella sp. NML01-A-086]OAM42977.1 hypothetical protein A7Q02_01035 [Eikenella sp. NML97-A-109]QED92365.1 hypothetical protein EZJ17_06910 [Eikenella exigua]